MWGTQYYSRTPKSIIEEMIELKKRFSVEHFDFADLTTTINKVWTKELCERIINSNLNVSWQFGAGTRSEPLTDEILMLFKKANLYRLSFA